MKSIKVSQRVKDQIPAFIKEEDPAFVDLIVEYYRSQEKSGKPYDILNNILSYTDISSGEYDPNFLGSESIVLNRVGPTDINIDVKTSIIFSKETVRSRLTMKSSTMKRFLSLQRLFSLLELILPNLTRRSKNLKYQVVV